jgi:hypothetical protein
MIVIHEGESGRVLKVMKQISDVCLTLTSLFEDLPPQRSIEERYAASDGRGSIQLPLGGKRLWTGLPTLDGVARSERGAL